MSPSIGIKMEPFWNISHFLLKVKQYVVHLLLRILDVEYAFEIVCIFNTKIGYIIYAIDIE